MSQDITRRDFLNGMALAIAAGIACGIGIVG